MIIVFPYIFILISKEFTEAAVDLAVASSKVSSEDLQSNIHQIFVWQF
jgi:hypothetical protein